MNPEINIMWAKRNRFGCHPWSSLKTKTSPDVVNGGLELGIYLADDESCSTNDV